MLLSYYFNEDERIIKIFDWCVFLGHTLSKVSIDSRKWIGTDLVQNHFLKQCWQRPSTPVGSSGNLRVKFQLMNACFTLHVGGSQCVWVTLSKLLFSCCNLAWIHLWLNKMGSWQICNLIKWVVILSGIWWSLLLQHGAQIIVFASRQRQFSY